MQITINLEHSVADEILLTGLKEYHKYLIMHPFQSDVLTERHDRYDVLVDAFEVVLRCYMHDSEWEEYSKSLTQ